MSFKLVVTSMLLGLTLGVHNAKIVQQETKTMVAYNRKILDFGDKSVVNKNDSIYNQLRALGSELGYT